LAVLFPGPGYLVHTSQGIKGIPWTMVLLVKNIMVGLIV